MGFISKDDGNDGKPTQTEFIWICVGSFIVLCGVCGLPTVAGTSLAIVLLLAVILVPLVLILLLLSSTFLALPILVFVVPVLLIVFSPLLAVGGCFCYAYRANPQRRKKPKLPKVHKVQETPRRRFVPQKGLENSDLDVDMELAGMPIKLDLSKIRPGVVNLRDSTETAFSRPSRNLASGSTGRDLSVSIAANVHSLNSGRGHRFDEPAPSSGRGIAPVDYWNQ